MSNHPLNITMSTTNESVHIVEAKLKGVGKVKLWQYLEAFHSLLTL